jgi:hypothetical protein
MANIQAWHNLTSDQYQQTFDQLTAEGSNPAGSTGTRSVGRTCSPRFSNNNGGGSIRAGKRGAGKKPRSLAVVKILPFSCLLARPTGRDSFRRDDRGPLSSRGSTPIEDRALNSIPILNPALQMENCRFHKSGDSFVLLSAMCNL